MSEKPSKLTRAPRGSSERILAPFSPEEAREVRETARASGMEVGAWLRMQALAGLRK